MSDVERPPRLPSDPPRSPGNEADGGAPPPVTSWDLAWAPVLAEILLDLRYEEARLGRARRWDS